MSSATKPTGDANQAPTTKSKEQRKEDSKQLSSLERKNDRNCRDTQTKLLEKHAPPEYHPKIYGDKTNPKYEHCLATGRVVRASYDWIKAGCPDKNGRKRFDIDEENAATDGGDNEDEDGGGEESEAEDEGEDQGKDQGKAGDSNGGGGAEAA